MHLINGITAAGAVVLLLMSIWPGYAGGCMACVAYPAIAALGLAWLVTVSRGRRQPDGRRTPYAFRYLAIAPLLVCTTYVALAYYIPRRVVFAFCRPSFEALTQSAPVSGYRGAPLNRRIGPFMVDAYATDPRGGVYFRTGIGPDGIGPDRMSYGFCYEPNDKSTPFGAAHYRVWRLIGKWYWFRASDDWYEMLPTPNPSSAPATTTADATGH